MLHLSDPAFTRSDILAMTLPPGILIGGIVLLVLIVALVAVRSIRTMMRRLRQSVPAALMQELRKDIESGDLARRLQEPVSLSGMDRIYRPEIQADFPELNLDELSGRARQLATTTLLAIDAENPGLLSESAPLYSAQVRHYIENLQSLGKRERYDGITIHRQVISDYRKDAGTCRIRFQLAVGARISREGADELDRMDVGGITQFKCELEALYIQDRELARSGAVDALAFSCPNCGAPVPALGEKTCDYCGSAIEPLTIRVWTFSSFSLSGFISPDFLIRFVK